MAKYRPKENDRVWVSGDSADLWLTGYNVRVDSGATVIATPGPGTRKTLVTIDMLDHESNVTAYVKTNRLRPLTEQELTESE